MKFEKGQLVFSKKYNDVFLFHTYSGKAGWVFIKDYRLNNLIVVNAEDISIYNYKEQFEYKVLALDPATKFGWAISPQIYGIWDFKVKADESSGMKLLRFESKLIEMVEKHGINLIVYEAPSSRFAAALIPHAKLVGVIEAFCLKRNIEYRGYAANSIKKHATGKGNAKKPQMIAAAKEKFGYLGNDDNEADALHLLDLGKSDLGV